MAAGLPSYRRMMPRYTGTLPRYNKRKYRDNGVLMSSKLSWEQKNINAQQQISLVSDMIARRNEFTPRVKPSPSEINHMTGAQVVDSWRSMAADTMGAKENQKESARTSLGGHLKWFGKRLLDIISIPGEEMAAGVVLLAQKFIKGEQTFERAVRLDREENSRWKIPGMGGLTISKPLYQIARERDEEGKRKLGVPWYVSLPLEIAFDPLNVLMTPLGAAAVRGAKGVGSGVKAASRLIDDAGFSVSADSAYAMAAKYPGLSRQYKKTGRVFSVDKEGIVTDPWSSYAVGEDDLFSDLLIGRGGRRFYKSDSPRTWEDWKAREEASLEYEGLGIPKEELELYTPRELEQRAEWLGEYPTNPVAKRPDRAAILEIVDKGAEIALREGPDSDFIREVDVWAYKALLSLNIRPVELQQLTLEGLTKNFRKSPDNPRPYITVEPPKYEMKEVGKKIERVKVKGETLASNRYISDEGVAFIEDFLKKRPKLTTDTKLGSKAFILDEAWQGATSGGVGNKLGKNMGSTTHLNNTFARLIYEHFPDELGGVKQFGPNGVDAYSELLNFNTGNLTYVFRYSGAGHVYEEAAKRGARRLAHLEVMRALGHTNPRNTARYLSQVYWLPMTMETFVKEFYWSPGALDEAIETAGYIPEKRRAPTPQQVKAGIEAGDTSLELLEPAKPRFWELPTTGKKTTKGAAGREQQKIYDDSYNSKHELLGKLEIDEEEFKNFWLDEKGNPRFTGISEPTRRAYFQYVEVLRFAEILEHMSLEKLFIQGPKVQKTAEAAAKADRQWISTWAEPLAYKAQEFLDKVSYKAGGEAQQLQPFIEGWGAYHGSIGSSLVERAGTAGRAGGGARFGGKSTTLSTETHAGINRTTGWIVQQKGGDKAIKTMKGLDGQDVDMNPRRKWYVFDWVTKTDEEGVEVLTGVKLTRASVTNRQGLEVVRGRTARGAPPDAVEIPIGPNGTERFRVIYASPVPAQLVVDAAPPGVVAMSADRLAERMFKFGVSLDYKADMATMRRTLNGNRKRGLSEVPSSRVLNYKTFETTNAGPGDLWSSKLGWHKETRSPLLIRRADGEYEFSQDVKTAFEQRMAKDDSVSSFGYGLEPLEDAVTAKSVKPPVGDSAGWEPPSGYTNSPGGGEPPWNKPRVPDGEGGFNEFNIGKFLPVPQGMEQLPRAWTDGSVARWFYEKTAEIPGAHKLIRYAIGEGWMPNAASKLIWTRAQGVQEARQISQGATEIIRPITSEFGVEPRGVATRIHRNPDAGNWFDPETGHPAIRGYKDKLEDLQEKFPHIWTKQRVDAQLTSWSYNDELLRITTVLETPREDLVRWYRRPDGVAGLTDKQQQLYDMYHHFDPGLWALMEQRGFSLDEILEETLKKGKRDSWFVPHLRKNTFQGVVGSDMMYGTLGDLPVQLKGREFPRMIIGELEAEHDFLAKSLEKTPLGASLKEENLLKRLDVGGVRKVRGRDLYHQDPVYAMNKQIESYYMFMLDQDFMYKFETELGIPTAMKTSIIETGGTLIKAKAAGTVNELTSAQKDRLSKWFGNEWESQSSLVTNQLMMQYERMSDSWYKAGEQILNDGFKLDSSQLGLSKVSLSPEASKEFAAFHMDVFQKPGQLVTAASSFSNLVRIMATGADFGVMFLHGFGGIGMMLNPFDTPKQARLAWANGVKQMMSAMVNPEIKTLWMQQKFEVLREMQQHNVSFMSKALLEDMPIAGLERTGALASKYPTAAKAGELAARPMEMFGYFLDVSKVEMWEAFSPVIRNSPDFKIQDLTDFAASLNAVHGTLDPAVAGLRYRQRVVESGFLLYAALFRRASVALLGNLTSGQKWRRAAALRAVSGMAAAGGAFGSAIYAAGLNDKVFEPDSPDFMSAKVGPVRIGLGTPFYSFVRLGNNLFEQMRDDPKGIYDFTPEDHVVLRWMRSQTSPFTSLVTDLVVGRTFVGDPLRDTDGSWEKTDISKRFYRQFAPFWVENIVEQPGIGKLSSLAELFGLRSSPISTFSQLREAQDVILATSDNPEIIEWRNLQTSRGLSTTSKSAPRMLLKQISLTYPHIKDFEDEIADELNTRGRREQQDRQKYIDGINNNRASADLQLEGISKNFKAGKLSGKNFRLAVRLVEMSLRGGNKQLSETYRDVVDEFAKRREARLENSADMFYMDALYDKYRQDVTSNPTLHDEYGNFEPKVFEQLQSGFRAGISNLEWNYIKERRRAGRFEPEAVKDLHKGREKLAEIKYWDAADLLWGVGSWQANMVEDYISSPTRESQDRLMRLNPMLKGLLARVKASQRQMRLSDPTVDLVLVRFYDYAALTSLGKQESEKRLLLSR
jgi:hypothetical protein